MHYLNKHAASHKFSASGKPLWEFEANCTRDYTLASIRKVLLLKIPFLNILLKDLKNIYIDGQF